MDTVSRLAVSPAASPAAAASAGVVAIDNTLLAHRLGRMMGGVVLALGPALVFAQYALINDHPGDEVMNLVPLFACLWVSAAIARAAGRAIGRTNAVRAFFGDDSFAVASYVVPAVGVAFVAPLSLQAIVGAPFWVTGFVLGDPEMMGRFDHWVFFALMGTIHVHVAFAVVLGLAARRVARGSADHTVALFVPVALSFVPGILIFFPPLLVWVTGAAIRCGFLRLARRWRDEEGATFADAVRTAG